MRIIRTFLIIIAALALVSLTEISADATSVAVHHGGGSAHPAPAVHGGGGSVHPAPYHGGGYGHGGYGHGHGYYGGHGYGGHGYYGGHYGYPYYGYSHFGFGFGFGYPYYGYYPFYGYGYAPYAYAPYYAPYSYGYSYLGEVRTEVKPQKAQVYVDSGYVGTADSFDGWWQRLNLEPGNHRLVFRAVGFKPYVIDLKIVPGQDYHIKYEMEPGQDSITEQEMRPEPDQNADKGYDRGYRDQDRYRGNDQYGNDQYRDRENDQYRDRDYDQDQNDRNQNYDERRPSERYGNEPRSNEQRSNQRTLTLQVQPSDATVYIDGTYYGPGEGGNIQVMLPDGSHKIEVVRPGYETFTKDVNVGANSTSSVTIMLQKK